MHHKESAPASATNTGRGIVQNNHHAKEIFCVSYYTTRRGENQHEKQRRS